MSKQLKITADTSSVAKSITDLSNIAKRDLGKSKIQLFSKDTDKLLKGEAKSALKEINKVSKDIKSEIDKQAKSIAKTTQGTKEHQAEVRKLIDLQKKLLDVEKQRSSISQVAKGGMGSKGGMGGLLGKLGGGGGGGGMMGAIGSIGKFLGPVGAIAGMAGLYGASRLKAGAQRYGEGVDNRLLLRGRGVRDFGFKGEQGKEASQYGLDLNTVESRRMKAMDAFGRSGATTEAVLGRAKFERGMGLQGGTMTGIGAGLRGQMGGARADTATIKLQASALASGVDDAIGPYLETAASMLTAINENGLSNQSEVLGALAKLTAVGAEAPEIISGQLMTMDQTLRASSGERNAFAQTAFANAGIGGGTIGGTQMAIRSGGMFGADLSGLPEEQQKTLGGMGVGKAGFKERSGALLSQFSNLGFKFDKGASQQDLTSAGRGAMGFLGAKNEVEGLKMLDLLKKAQGGDEAASKKLSDMQKDPQLRNLEDIKSSNEGQLSAVEALTKTMETELGEKIAPATIMAKNALLNIDSMISGLLGFFGVQTAAEKQTEVMSGESVISKKSVENMLPKEKAAAQSKVEDTIREKQERLNSLKGKKFSDSFFEKSPIAESHELKKELSRLKESNSLLGGTNLTGTNSKTPFMTQTPESKDLGSVTGILEDVVKAINTASTENINNRRQLSKKNPVAPIIRGGNPKTFGN